MAAALLLAAFLAGQPAIAQTITVTDVTLAPPPSGDTYKSGQTIKVTFDFSDFVNVEDPVTFEEGSLTLRIGNKTRSAVVDVGQGGNNIKDDVGFKYVVLPADVSTSCISLVELVNVRRATNGELLTFTLPGLTACYKVANDAPLAYPGENQTVDEGARVTLGGSSTDLDFDGDGVPEVTKGQVGFDHEGDAFTYAWTAPEGVTLSNPSAARPAFTAPQVDGTESRNFVFSLTVTESGAGGLASTPATVTVTVNDTVQNVALSVNRSAIAEDDGATAVEVTATIQDSATFATDTTVRVTVAGSGNPGAVDFTPVPAFDITIPAGTSSATGTFTLTPIADTLDEDDETVTVSGRLTGVTVRAATINLSDDGDMPALKIDSPSVAEGESGTKELPFTVTLSKASAQTVTVSYATSDGTAEEGTDYTATSGELTFQAGETSKRLAVTVMGDEVVEDDETFMVVLSEPTNARFAVRTGTGTIANDDEDLVKDPELQRTLAVFGRTVASNVVRMMEDRAAAQSPGESQAPLSVSSLSSGEWPGGGFRLVQGGNDTGGGAGSWTLWARGATTVLEGGPRSGLSVEGEVVTGHLGVDFRAHEEWLAGFAVSHDSGEFDYRIRHGGTKGGMDATLTGIHPYVHWWPRSGLGLWATLGYGRGDAKPAEPAGGNREEMDLGMRMAAAGARKELESGESTGWALKADAFVVRVEGERKGGLPGVESNAHRIRLMLEGGGERELLGGSKLSGHVELGARVDGGDADKGQGAELGGKVAYAGPGARLRIEARSHVVLAHQESQFKEWGASVVTSISPRGDGRGLSLRLASTRGKETGGAEALWQGGHGVGEPGASGSRAGLGAGYGIGLANGLLTPFGEMGMESDGSRSLRLGARLRQWGARMSMYGEQLSRRDEAPVQRIGLTVVHEF